MNTIGDFNSDKEITPNQMCNMNVDKALWTPIKIVQTYLALILILFIFGPWPWPMDNKLLVYFYLFVAQLLLFFGYFLSVRRKKITIYVAQSRFFKISSYNNLKLIKFLLILSFIIFIPSYMARAGLNSFSITGFYDAFVKGLLNPGAQYYDKLNLSNQASSNYLLLILSALTSPFRWLFIPLCIVNWGSLPRRYKVSSMMFILLDTISWISIGTNKGIFDNVFIIAFSLLIKIYISNRETRGIKHNKKSKVAIFLFSLSILSLAITYMTKAIISRLGVLNYYSRGANIYVNFDSPIMSIIPGFLKDTLVIMAGYTTQGYYGLSLAMKEPFTTTYGLGNSWFLMSIIEKITGYSTIAENTYPFKIAGYGWDPYVNWHSIYTWLASDFSFLGTLLIIIIIGYWFGEVWKSVLFQRNIYAIGLFILFMIMFMYFPANNQVFAFINTFSAFWGLFILWFFSAKVRI